jgi:hypothetical protein
MDKKRIRPSKRVIEMAPPNVRPCAVCREDRPIVAHGMCDRCRKRQERGNNRLLYTPASAVHISTGTKNLSILYTVMRNCKVTSDVQRVVLVALLPFMGLPRDAQEGHLKALKRQADEEASGSDDEWDVHAGSSLAPDDSVNREPEG